MKLHCIALCLPFLLLSGFADEVDSGPPFGPLPLIDEIDCAATSPQFIEAPTAASHIETLLGAPCRVLPPCGGSAAYMGWRIGKGKGLVAGKCYLLCVDYPEDEARSFHVANWGCETVKGVATGAAVGDVFFGRYVHSNPESIQYPLSGSYETWRQLFFLHDRTPGVERPRGAGPRPFTPNDGFLVILAQPEKTKAPQSAGAAVRRIRLFEVPNPARFNVALRLPPDDLPRRHLFWREEMADGVVAMGHRPEEKDPTLRGVENPLAWYEHKAKLARILGMNTYCKDLLEFGHNQGWDSRIEGRGGSDWYNQSSTPELWSNILTMLGDYDLDVLPYYEYAGGIGQSGDLALGSQRRCRTLAGGQDYTHISWCHKTNADLADPDFVVDAKRLLDHTIVRYKDKVNFLGAWFRPRPEANPISFSDTNLARFSKETQRSSPIERAALKSDRKLLDEYYAWWMDKRAEFLTALADHLRDHVDPDAFLLYTADAAEAGCGIPASLAGEGEKEPWRWKNIVVSDRSETWDAILKAPPFAGDQKFQFFRSLSLERVVQGNLYGRGLLLPRTTWGPWEWQHGCPWPDPANYSGSDKVMMSYTFNRLYTIAAPAGMEPFRTARGLAMIRHYNLNEDELEIDGKKPLGYFVSDVEQSGPFSMAAEAWAVAHGDPRYIGYLSGNSFNRGYPEHARAFNAAFLALPALPGKRLPGATSDPEVVVRAIPTPRHGTWLAVVNTGFSAKHAVQIRLPEAGRTTDAATGEPLEAKDGSLTLPLGPCQLRALHIE